MQVLFEKHFAIVSNSRAPLKIGEEVNFIAAFFPQVFYTYCGHSSIDGATITVVYILTDTCIEIVKMINRLAYMQFSIYL